MLDAVEAAKVDDRKPLFGGSTAVGVDAVSKERMVSDSCRACD